MTFILEEFQDLLPNELLQGFRSSLGDIQHQIDLALGSTLPTRPHYHMTPVEHEKLRCQMEGLLEK